MAMSKAAKWIPFAVSPSQQPQVVAPSSNQGLVSLDALPEGKQFGLENFGSTCYANSVLQALYFCTPFRDLVVQSTDISVPPPPKTFPRTLTAPSSPQTATTRRKPERTKHISDAGPVPPSLAFTIPSSPPTLFSALRSLYVFISNNPQEKGTVAPRAFVDKLRELNELFRSNMHQDAHEFLNYLLNRIVEEIQKDRNHKDPDFNASGEDLSTSVATLSSAAPTSTPSASGSSPADSTFVHRLFEGVLTSETRCLTCETVSSRDESFLDLSIDIEQNSSVTACLRQFSASEMLCQKNKFFCDSCCGLQEAEKRMKIKKLPNILALHLKRFKYQEDVQKYIKLAYRVAFPLELRLFNTVDDAENPDRLYELFAIVVHIGSGPHHGHYITIVKGPLSWLIFDDDKIDPIKESEIPKYFGDNACGSAYVLYYQATEALVAATAAAASNHLNGIHLHRDADGALPPGLDTNSDTSRSSPLISLPALPSPAGSTDHLNDKVPRPSPSLAEGRGANGSARNSSKESPQSPLDKKKSKDKAEVPPVPAVPHVYINGKEKDKEPERKPSLWFKRRSLRPDKKDKDKLKDTIPASPTGPAFSPLISPTVSQSTTMSVAPSGRTTASRAGQQSSSYPVSSNTASASGAPSNSSLPLVPQSLVVVPSLAGSLESPAATSTKGTDSVSATSSIASSNSNAVPSPPPSSFPHHSIPPHNDHHPPVPAVSSPLASPPASPRAPPEHKKSHNFLSSRRKHFSASAVRPSTAGATPSKHLSKLSELPPVPTPTLSHTPASPVTSDLSDGPATDSEALRAQSSLRRSGSERWRRPHSVHGHNLGLGGLSGKSSPMPDNVKESEKSDGGALPVHTKEGGGGLRKAARKLSFTAPMFGLGRKDRAEREEKKKASRAPPAAFAGAATMSMATR
ncbi:cysteine proteinase [Dentipellis sp. KUC8613]|nr:cysteine proteinase [Dentipellis sp. KUC8613]